jgi:hypothetical protein
MTVEVVSTRRRRIEPYLDIKPSTAPWLIKGVLPETGVAFLAGATMAGKSFLAIDMALRIATGMKVFGRKCAKAGVVYIGAEDAAGCRLRVSAWRKYYRRDTWTAFHFLDADPNLLDQSQTDELLLDLQESAEAFEAEGVKLGLVVIDTFSRCLPGVEENSSSGMSQAFTALKRICSVTGALVLVIAHFGKDGEDRGIRGWSGLDANSDATITLVRNDEEPDLRVLKLHKVKNGVAGNQMGFRLKGVGLGLRDEDGDEVASCVCDFEPAPPLGKRPALKRKAMNVPEQMVFTAIKQLTDYGRTQPVPESIIGAKPWQKAITRPDLKTKIAGGNFAYEGEKEDATRMRFSRALQGLATQQRIRMEGELIWLL